jgi:hypothetical protein
MLRSDRLNRKRHGREFEIHPRRYRQERLIQSGLGVAVAEGTGVTL